MEDIDLKDSSVLDVGCGFGGLYKYLISNLDFHLDYMGVDIVPKMIEVAKESNPTGKFMVADILKDDIPNYDHVFCIGTLNITTENYSEYFMDMLRKMISIARKTVVVCFLSDKKYLEAGPYHFENPVELKKKIEDEFDALVEIRQDKRIRGESCIVVRKR